MVLPDLRTSQRRPQSRATTRNRHLIRVFVALLATAASFVSFVAFTARPPQKRVLRGPHKSEMRGFEKKKQFRPVTRSSQLNDNYITLWLHQVHRWFKPKDSFDSKEQIRKFLQQAKNAGFTSVMGDIPWEWTERDRQGDIQLHSVGKDWMAIACELGLSLHVVITMRECPPWLKKIATPDFFELSWTPQHGKERAGTPALANPVIWKWMQNFTHSTSHLLLQEYGECIRSISPTVNNEFETRFTQTRDAMRDYSASAIDLFKEWQITKGIVQSKSDTFEPPQLPATPICEPIDNKNTWQWLGFREEFIASRYEDLCKAVHDSAVVKNGKRLKVNCLLHFGEMFATTDLLHSNAFFKLAKSNHVDEIVMDSNMALSGAPSSPSVVGILISTAQTYGKLVHYEAATERILSCDDSGHISTHSQNNWDAGGPLLLRKGIQYALEAGVQSIGITNLCVPSMAGNLFALYRDKLSSAVRVAYPFKPSALIYVPYRAMYAWKHVISDVSCGIGPIACWHESFANMKVFGNAAHAKKRNMCPVDVAQDALIQVWDELRTRHSHIAVIGDVEQLNEDMLKQATERVLLKFPCVMEGPTWSFYEGQEIQEQFIAKSKQHPFEEHLVDALSRGKCSAAK